MDLESLRKETVYQQKKYDRFRKIIRKLESLKIIDSFPDNYSKKKFIFLTKLGERLINDTGHPISLSRDTLFHDARVGEIVRMLMVYPNVYDVDLEHLISNRSKFDRRADFIPDACLKLKKEKKGMTNIAIELEISRKTKRRIDEKLCYFSDNSYYEFVYYFLPGQGLFELIKGRVEQLKDQSKFILFFLPNIFSKKISFDDGFCLHQMTEYSIDEFLNRSFSNPIESQEVSDEGNISNEATPRPSKFLSLFDRGS